MHIVTMTLIALVVAAPAVAQAQVQVHVDIGIHLPAPPRLVVVPQVPAVRYVAAPAAPGNLFFYSGQYWAFANGGWYVSGGYNGPWVVVAPRIRAPARAVRAGAVLPRPARSLEEVGARSGLRTGRRTGDVSGPTSASGSHGTGTATTTIATTGAARARGKGHGRDR